MFLLLTFFVSYLDFAPIFSSFYPSILTIHSCSNLAWERACLGLLWCSMVESHNSTMDSSTPMVTLHLFGHGKILPRFPAIRRPAVSCYESYTSTSQPTQFEEEVKVLGLTGALQ